MLFRREGFLLGVKHAKELEGISDKEERAAVRKEQVLDTLLTAACGAVGYAVVAAIFWAIAKIVQILF